MILPSVLEAFPIVTRPLEGCVLSPYLDVFGYATVGYGCLCDTLQSFEQVEWDGKPSASQIVDGWHALKSMPKALHWKQYERATPLRMTQAGADKLLDLRAENFADYMQAHYLSEWDEWPADAQMACMLMSWACGPSYLSTFKNFLACVVKRDFIGAIACAKISTQGNAGIVPRNAQVALCLANAAAIDTPGYSTPALYWPGTVHDDPAPSAATHLAYATQTLARFSFEKHGTSGHAHGPELAA